MTVETSGMRVPFWLENLKTAEFAPLAADISVDVCIIGGGISGLTTAYLLSKQQKTVALVEDGVIGSGETGRTTAHISNALDDRYTKIEKLHGAEAARLAAQSHTAAINQIEQIVKEEHIDCDFERLDGYLIATPGGDSSVLEKELIAAQQAGLTDVEWAEKCPIENLSSERCVRFPQQAQFHPGKYLAQLAVIAAKNKVQIYEHTHAINIKEGKEIIISTAAGCKITAKSLVLATNAPILDHEFLFSKMEPCRTYVIAAKIPKNSLAKALYWDTANPYHYIRTQNFDDQADLLMVGGEDHRTGTKHTADEAFQRLEAWTKARFPQLKSIDYRWSGQVLEPVDYLAFIGRDSSKAQNNYLVTGDSGNGITHGTIAGILITDLIVGNTNPWQQLYAPTRNTIKSFKNLLSTNLAGSASYAKYLTPGEVNSIDEIPIGEGAIIRKGLAKVAVYRDEQGKVCEFSAVCPHMKGILEWNPAEKTWDCPAHGSRFSASGEVLNGPAKQALEQIALAKTN